MTNKIEGHIGCPEHGAYFRLESVPGSNAGVRMHDKINLDASKIADGALHCPVEGCGAALVRVKAPT